MYPQFHVLSKKEYIVIIHLKITIFTLQKMLNTVIILRFQTDWSWKTVQTQIRLLLEEQSDQGIHCLLFYLHLSDEIP